MAEKYTERQIKNQRLKIKNINEKLKILTHFHYSQPNREASIWIPASAGMTREVGMTEEARMIKEARMTGGVGMTEEVGMTDKGNVIPDLMLSPPFPIRSGMTLPDRENDIT